MKKLLAILLALAMVFALAACGSKESSEAPAAEEPVKEEKTEETEEKKEEAVGVPNPLTEYASLEELNEALGGAKLAKPGVMGVSDESYNLIAGEYPVGQYKFSVNGMEYCLRASTDYYDISGYYAGEGTVFSGLSEISQVLVQGKAKLARWFSGDYQYCLCIDDNGEMSDSTFDSILSEIKILTSAKELSAEEALYLQLEGVYQDSYSQRATASASNAGEYLAMYISWSSSANEHIEWAMTMKETESGVFSYTDGIERLITYTDEATYTEEILADNMSGYFTLDEGYNLKWNGAPEENCRECVFEKIFQYDAVY